MKIKKTASTQKYDEIWLKLKQEIIRRKAAEKSLKEQGRGHKSLMANSQHLSRRILLAQENERKEISQKLHNQVAQILVGISLYLGVLKNDMSPDSDTFKTKMIRIQKLVEKLLSIVRRFAHDLRPAALDHLGLIPTLTSYIEKFTKRTGIPVAFNASSGAEELSNAKRTLLYRVAQEALSNVARHSRASFVEVDIQKIKENNIVLTIKDNGKILFNDTVTPRKKGRRLGLPGIRERVEMVKGRLTVEFLKDIGTEVGAEVPIS